jgi:type II secretory pathway predicted ATPase ExeA
VHLEALAHLRSASRQCRLHGADRRGGRGQTTLLQALLRTLEQQATVARLVNTLLAPQELLEAILIDFGVDDVPASKPAMVRELARILVDHRQRNRRVIVVIDEAQNLSHGALEELRMLSNLETEKSKLMQIVLAGQPELGDRLETPQLEQLRQRITVRFHVTPLDENDTYHYINHRLKHASIDRPLTFGREITATIHERSGGLPRLINTICDATLMAGYGEDRQRITSGLVASVIRDLESNGLLGSRTPGRRPWAQSAVGWSAEPESPASIDRG